MAKVYKIATIAGDGIGLEVLPEGVKEAAILILSFRSAKNYGKMVIKKSHF